MVFYKSLMHYCLDVVRKNRKCLGKQENDDVCIMIYLSIKVYRIATKTMHCLRNFHLYLMYVFLYTEMEKEIFSVDTLI